jgi:hypothetical protein
MKLKIDNEALAQEFFENTVLLGIVAPLKGYLLSWQLNHLLEFDFRLNAGLEIQLTKKGRDYFFSVYEYKIKNATIYHYLYCNHFDGEYLLPEFKHLDYLWLVKAEDTVLESQQPLLNSIKKLPGVQLVTELTNEKIRHKQHLIL